MKRRVVKTILALSLTIIMLFNYSTASKVEASMGSWKSDANGWWYDLDGSYARGWREIDGYWYFFTSTGYMDYSEYRDGCWLNADGTCNTAYSGGHWASDSTGWWYTDNSGWYPVSTWLWIDGSCYYFKASGYLAHDEYVDGYYLDSSGVYTSDDGSQSGSHTHTWVCTKEAWDEQVLVKDAWDEQVPKYKSVQHRICCDCGYDFGPVGVLAGACPTCGCWDCTAKMVDELVGYDTVHHDAEYKTVHHDAEYTCSTCGATK